MTSKGRNMITDSQLNMSWTTAPAKARRNSFRSAACARETMVLVTDVPMLAPITIGIAGSTCKTTKIHNTFNSLYFDNVGYTALSIRSLLEICCLASTYAKFTLGICMKPKIQRMNKYNFNTRCANQNQFSRSNLQSHVFKWQTIANMWTKYKSEIKYRLSVDF